MSEREIDELLSTWKRRLSAAAQNLVDLRAHPSYQRIAGTNHSPRAQLAGITSARVSPALDAMSTLFEHFDLIQQAVDRAEVLRRDRSVFGNDQRLREIEQLLRGKSIHLPAVQVPFEQRSLLSAVENVEVISPEDLLNAMTRAFEATRDGVLTLDSAWRKLEPALDNAKAEIANLSVWDVQSAAGQAADLDAAANALEKLRAEIQRDPLGVEAGFESEVRPAIERVRATLDQLAGERKRIEDGLRAAHARMDQLSSLHRETESAYAESLEKVSDCGELKAPLPAERIEAVREWLQRLERTYVAGTVKPLSIGLQNWNSTVDGYVTSIEEAYRADHGPLELRSELRGRLDALKAKARAYGLAEDPGLMESAAEAMALLFTRPTPIRRAEVLVARYEARLNGRTAQATE